MEKDRALNGTLPAQPETIKRVLEMLRHLTRYDSRTDGRICKDYSYKNELIKVCTVGSMHGIKHAKESVGEISLADQTRFAILNDQNNTLSMQKITREADPLDMLGQTLHAMRTQKTRYFLEALGDELHYQREFSKIIASMSSTVNEQEAQNLLAVISSLSHGPAIAIVNS